MDSPIFVGTLTWVAVALTCYLLLRRIAYNLLDPLAVLAIFIPFSASLLAVLCDTGLVPWSKFLLFALVLLGYLLGARIAGTLFGRQTFRRLIIETVSSVRAGETYAMFLITATLTLLLAVLAIHFGAQGDARQAFLKSFRPIVLVQTGLFYISAVLLSVPKFPTARAVAFMCALVALSVPFSGKSILAPLVFWFGLRLFVSGRRVTLKTAMSMGSVAVAGVVLMGLIAYGRSTIAGALRLLVIRLWLSGDAYIYAYQQHGLALARGYLHVSFLRYMLHPITAIFGFRAYDVPLGGVLEAVVTGSDRIAGPNPQLPVVLDYFFPNQLGVSVLIAFVIGVLVMIVRPACLELGSSRSRYLKLAGIAAAVFCPGSGFQDTSQVLIGIIALCAAGAFASFLELLFARKRSRSESRPPAARTSDQIA